MRFLCFLLLPRSRPIWGAHGFFWIELILQMYVWCLLSGLDYSYWFMFGVCVWTPLRTTKIGTAPKNCFWTGPLPLYLNLSFPLPLVGGGLEEVEPLLKYVGKICAYREGVSIWKDLSGRIITKPCLRRKLSAHHKIWSLVWFGFLKTGSLIAQVGFEIAIRWWFQSWIPWLYLPNTVIAGKWCWGLNVVVCLC